MTLPTEESATITRLNRDLRVAATSMTAAQARYLVDAYYQVQEHRIALSNQQRSLRDAEEPHQLIDWLVDQTRVLEGQIKAALDKYTDGQPIGQWAKAQKGIGPVICAGLLAHIDIERVSSYGQIFSFAGLTPGVKWEKGQKRPWNGRLKTLCWKMGESFVKVSGADDAFYGQLYKTRKALEETRNASGEFADQAAQILREKKFRGDTKAKACYEQGILPPAHVHARAKRYAVKMFLSHLFMVWFKLHRGTEPPQPYPIAHMGHVDVILPPGPAM